MHWVFFIFLFVVCVLFVSLLVSQYVSITSRNYKFFHCRLSDERTFVQKMEWISTLMWVEKYCETRTLFTPMKHKKTQPKLIWKRTEKVCVASWRWASAVCCECMRVWPLSSGSGRGGGRWISFCTYFHLLYVCIWFDMCVLYTAHTNWDKLDTLCCWAESDMTIHSTIELVWM